MRTLLAVLLGFVACTGPSSPTPPEGDCPLTEQPTVELGQEQVWNLPDGTVAMGIPPQGGAPYSPFEIRLTGVPAADTYRLEFAAIDGQGATLGEGSYTERFVCANVGDHAGTRYNPDLHLRYFGSEPDDLDGVQVDVNVQVFVDDTLVASEVYDVELDWTLGPMP